MNQQKTLMSYFNTSVKKCKLKDSIETMAPNAKRAKVDPLLDKKSDIKPLVHSSPEAAIRIENNRRNAKIILQCKRTPALYRNIGPTWFTALEKEFSKDYFIKLGQFLEEERSKNTVFPPAEHVFSWTTMCPIQEVKVVLLGQDPYHGIGQAHGLAFSVPKGVRPPPSLLNIYKELSTDIKDYSIPNHGDLSGWAKQGVLLLNACLTVRSGQANSHKDKGWEQLTDAVIKWINDEMKNVVFLLWGSYAQKKGDFINKNKHLVLKTVHPSPLSAHRGFLGCRHFSKANEYLVKSGRIPVAWSDQD